MLSLIAPELGTIAVDGCFLISWQGEDTLVTLLPIRRYQEMRCERNYLGKRDAEESGKKGAKMSGNVLPDVKGASRASAKPLYSHREVCERENQCQSTSYQSTSMILPVRSMIVRLLLWSYKAVIPLFPRLDSWKSVIFKSHTYIPGCDQCIRKVY